MMGTTFSVAVIVFFFYVTISSYGDVGVVSKPNHTICGQAETY